MAEALAAEELVERRLIAEQLRFATKQFARVPVIPLAINLFIVWLLARVDQLAPALLWLASIVSIELWRWRVSLAEIRQPAADPRPVLRRISTAFIVLGVLRALSVPLLFRFPIAAEHFLFTMVHLGVAAGAVATVGTVTRTYVTWAVVVGGSLVAGWASQGSTEGYWVALLMISLFGWLAASVRDQRATMRRLVRLAIENESLVHSLSIERDRTQAASESKTRFFAAASHDLRQPLHALSINATTLELLARRDGNPMMKELSHGITRALRQSNGLLDSLLEISRLDARAVIARPEAVHALSLMRLVRDGLASLAAQRGLRLTFDSGEGDEIWIRTDPELMRRVLENLLGNALKFTRQGEVRLCLAVADARTATIEVADSGPGIAAEEQERVFEEFYQVGNPSRDRSQGLGLGLSIVRRLAELLEIEVMLHSTPGSGTRFELAVPRAPAPLASSGEALADMPASQKLPTLGARVLVIDDEAEILESMAALLPQLGCEVRCASGSAQAALVLDAGFVPQVLVIDYRLQGETGVQAIEMLRQRLGPVPALIVTGDAVPAQLGARAGSDEVLLKPLEGARLALALERALARAARPLAACVEAGRD